MKTPQPCPFLKRERLHEQAVLGGGKLRTRRDHYMTGNSDDAFIWANTRAGRQRRCCIVGYVGPDTGKISVGHFKKLRAIVPERTGIASILSKPSLKCDFHSRSAHGA